MRQCLDEAMLQSYFDGELSTKLMESATLHLASCATCAAAARELEEENALLSEAFALEFSESVPTERLRHKVDAAIAGIEIVRPVVQRPSAVNGFFSSLSSLFSFSPQRAFGYAALMVVLAFGVIFGLVKFRSSAPVKSANTPQVAVNVQPKLGPTSTTDVSKETVNTVSTSEPTSVRSSKGSAIKAGYRPSLGKATTPKQSPVKLMPGERSYLQTIAKLDSTIKEGQKDMRPALQVEYERNLAVVDRAIAATRSEAKKNPNDPDAADFMFAAYQSKVDLLNTIADARVYNRTH
ncbi:MAG TPA: hypothetical protein VJ372_16055 [Pyrinomonadaceae bacterium]|jgi:Predicted transmembrane transcriptional regulator (anti-sigma factor)|nr:hypothetical protein [Pyrinomonadaceae bacterium]